jgi:hypothetical protein
MSYGVPNAATMIGLPAPSSALTRPCCAEFPHASLVVTTTTSFCCAAATAAAIVAALGDVPV